MYLLNSIFLLRYQPIMNAVSRPVKQLQQEREREIVLCATDRRWNGEREGVSGAHMMNVAKK